MATLPGSGQLTMWQIANHLNRPLSNISLRGLSAHVGFSPQDAISEFYNYNNCPPAWSYYTQYCDGCTLTYVYHDGNCGYYYSYQYQSSACGCGGAYYCQDYWGNCGIYQSPCWELGLMECGGGPAEQ
jgi:hypothetical protein